MLEKRKELQLEKREKTKITDNKQDKLKHTSKKHRDSRYKKMSGKGGGSDEEVGLLMEKTQLIDTNENDKLRYDDQQIDKGLIKTLINTKIKDCIKQKFERIRDNNETLTARFKQNEVSSTNILNQTQQNVGAVQILIYAVEIVPFDEVSRKKMRKQMYTKTFRISQTTTLASLKTTACEYWGLIEKDFMLYQVYQEQEKTEPKDLADEMDSKVTKLVD